MTLYVKRIYENDLVKYFILYSIMVLNIASEIRGWILFRYINITDITILKVINKDIIHTTLEVVNAYINVIKNN